MFLLILLVYVKHILYFHDIHIYLVVLWSELRRTDRLQLHDEDFGKPVSDTRYCSVQITENRAS